MNVSERVVCWRRCSPSGRRCVVKWSASSCGVGNVRVESVGVEVRSALVELELAVRAGRFQGGYVHEADAA
jgi:hypothetical protein